MTRRVAAFAVAVSVALPGAIVAQRAPVPRTADGRPDLQGIWDFRTATPLERPREFAGKPFFTPAEAAAFEQRAADRNASTLTVHAPGWLDYGGRVLPDLRTSLIVEPPDGRVPALTPAAQQRAAERAAGRRGLADGPEDLSLNERCILFSAGPPILPGPYNNNLQIVQTPASIVMLTEMIHDARVIALDGRPQPPDTIRLWLGASRGRWENDTLVVETTNFTPLTSFRGSDERLRLVEKFTRLDAETLRYEFTVDNPTAFTRSWTASYTMARTDDRIYEFACHEGNYGMANILRNARIEERQQSETQKLRN